MTSLIGQTVSHYKILEQLGSGGMGVVYKARDLKLDRYVALKFLHTDLTRDADLKGRFVLEAKTASSLRHANICVIHDIDEMDDGQMFIVMEYYEGETLKSKIEKGPLTIEEAIDTGMHVAGGLARAHEEHLVHRDIKPANIMIGSRGEVSILDFGLAKLTGGDRHTLTGSLLGTPAYMSPEQVRGEDVDHRTDIWSFGIVLYEMLTGSTPFGNYEPVLVYFILNEPLPPMVSKRGVFPEEVQRIVFKCLEKQPADRYQSLADLIVDLRRFKRSSDGSGRLPKSRILTGRSQFIRFSKRTRSVLAIAGGCVAVVLAIVLFWRPAVVHLISGILFTESPKKEVYWFTNGKGISDFPDWSPNGEGIVFASEGGGNMDIWKQRTPTSSPIRMTFSTANETYPAWSPDGRNIAFCSDSAGGMVMVVSSEGGTPSVIAPIKARPRWSPDSKRLSLDWKYAIYVLDFPPQGEPRQIVQRTTAEPSTVWSADGHHLIFWDRRQGDICVVPSRGGEVTPLNVVPNGEEVTGMSCSHDGSSLILCRGQFGGPKELWKLQIDPETCKPMGKPVQLYLSTDDIVRCSLSPDGKQLAFTARSVERYVYETSLDPRTGLSRGTPELLTTDRGLNYYPGLSRDGRRLVWTHQEANRAFLFVKDLPEGKSQKVTLDRGPETGNFNSLLPDSRRRIRFMVHSSCGCTVLSQVDQYE
jgi:serine/threonine protein kinase